MFLGKAQGEIRRRVSKADQLQVGSLFLTVSEGQSQKVVACFPLTHHFRGDFDHDKIMRPVQRSVPASPVSASFHALYPQKPATVTEKIAATWQSRWSNILWMVHRMVAKSASLAPLLLQPCEGNHNVCCCICRGHRHSRVSSLVRNGCPPSTAG